MVAIGEVVVPAWVVVADAEGNDQPQSRNNLVISGAEKILYFPVAEIRTG